MDNVKSVIRLLCPCFLLVLPTNLIGKSINLAYQAAYPVSRPAKANLWSGSGGASPARVCRLKD